jgi:HEPN domain-containing protein
MKPDPPSEASRWLRQAEQDLRDGVFCLEGGRCHLACFLAQQSAEKALKAALFARGAERVWGHSVAELCDDLARLVPGWSHLRASLAFLDRYYIPTRYPDGLPGGIPSEAFRPRDAEDALAAVRELLTVLSASSSASSN